MPIWVWSFCLRTFGAVNVASSTRRVASWVNDSNELVERNAPWVLSRPFMTSTLVAYDWPLRSSRSLQSAAWNFPILSFMKSTRKKMCAFFWLNDIDCRSTMCQNVCMWIQLKHTCSHFIVSNDKAGVLCSISTFIYFLLNGTRSVRSSNFDVRNK